MSDVVRVGYISAVNHAEGTAQVVYKDRDNSLSPFMPLWSNEWNPPEIDTMVYVIHLQNGGTRGMILVPPYNRKPARRRRGRDLAERLRRRKLYQIRSRRKAA